MYNIKRSRIFASVNNQNNLIMNSENILNGIEQLQKLGLNWDVVKVPITTNSIDIELSGIHIDKQALVREDNKKVLGIMGTSYQPFQNSEMFELVQKLAHANNREITNGGMFGGGKKVYMQIKTQNLSIGADTVEGYITVLNSFDGSTSLAFGNTNKTISCSNLFHGAYKQLNTRIRHTVSMRLIIEDYLHDYDQIMKNEKAMFDTIKRLSEQELRRSDIEAMEQRFFNIKDYNNLSTRKSNLLENFRLAVANEVEEKGANLWGAFSGLTKYTTHLDNSSEESKMTGNVSTRTRAVFSDFAELVK